MKLDIRPYNAAKLALSDLREERNKVGRTYNTVWSRWTNQQSHPNRSWGNKTKQETVEKYEVLYNNLRMKEENALTEVRKQIALLLDQFTDLENEEERTELAIEITTHGAWEAIQRRYGMDRDNQRNVGIHVLQALVDDEALLYTVLNWPGLETINEMAAEDIDWVRKGMVAVIGHNRYNPFKFPKFDVEVIH